MATVQDLPSLESLRDEQERLRSQLARLRRRLGLELGLELAAEATLSLMVAAALLVVLDWWFRPERAARFVILGASLTLLAGLLGVRTWRKWRAARLDELSLAVVLDRFRPGTGQQVADVLQLPGLLDEAAIDTVTSPALVRLAVRQACAALAGSGWRSLWNRRRTAVHLGLLGLALFVPTVFGWSAPGAARLSVARWLLGSSERWPQRTYLTVMGLDARGRLLAPRDEPVALEVRADLPLIEEQGRRWIVRGRDEPLHLRQKPAKPVAPSRVVVRERTADGKTREATMVAIGPGRYRYELAPTSASSTFELTGGDDWLGPIPIDRVDRPTLAVIKLRVREPGSSTVGFRDVADPRQHLLFLPDTEVDLTLIGNEELADTRLKVNPGQSPALDRLDPKSFAARWTLRDATTLEIQLTSRTTGLDSRPAFLSIGILRDREPRVTLRALGVGNHVTPVATVPLSLAATDDFGLGALRLQVDRTILRRKAMRRNQPARNPSRRPSARR